MTGTFSLEKGINSRWWSIWRISLGLVFSAGTYWLVAALKGQNLLLLLGVLFFAYCFLYQARILFFCNPLLKADARGLSCYASPDIIPWSNIKSITLGNSGNTSAVDTTYHTQNAMIATGAITPLAFNSRDRIKQSFSKATYIAIKLKDDASILSRKPIWQRWAIRLNQNVAGGSLLNLPAVYFNCDPDWLVSELQKMLTKYGSN